MNLSDARSIDPLKVTVTVTFDETDLTKAFLNQDNPDEQLSYDLFVRFRKLPISQQLTVLSKVALLDEAASVLNGTLSDPTTK